jgi:hypothetical protein
MRFERDVRPHKRATGVIGSLVMYFLLVLAVAAVAVEAVEAICRQVETPVGMHTPEARKAAELTLASGALERDIAGRFSVDNPRKRPFLPVSNLLDIDQCLLRQASSWRPEGAGRHSVENLSKECVPIGTD